MVMTTTKKTGATPESLRAIEQGVAAIQENFDGFVHMEMGWCATKGKRLVRGVFLRSMQRSRRYAFKLSLEKLLSNQRDVYAVERYYYVSEGLTLWFLLESETPRPKSTA